MNRHLEWRSLRRLALRAPGQVAGVWGSTLVWIALAPALFSVLAVLQWSSLPFPGAQRIVQVNAGLDLVPALRSSGRFAAVSPFEFGWVEIQGPRGAASILAATVDPTFFGVFESRPVWGRLFSARPGQADTQGVVLGASLARRLFGSTAPPRASLLRVEKQILPVLGVVADRPSFPPRAQAWIVGGAELRPDSSFLPNGLSSLGIVARLAPGTNLAAAEAGVKAAAREYERRQGASQGDVEVVRLDQIYRRTLRGERGLLFGSLMGLLAFEALACAVAFAGFLHDRRGELAIRAALGARRLDLLRLLLLQVVLLSLPGLAAGLPIGIAVLSRLAVFVPVGLAEILPSRLDLPSLALALLAWFASVLVGLWLASRWVGAGWTARWWTAESLVSQRTRAFSGRRLAMVGGALGLATALGLAATLLQRSLARLEEQPLGFDSGRVLVGVVRLSTPPALEDLAPTLARVKARLESVPGVRTASLATQAPFQGKSRFRELASVDRRQFWMGRVQGVDSSYWRVLRVPLVSGRLFDVKEERNGLPVAILDRQGAAEMFGEAPALGRTLDVDGRRVEIIGVVAPTKGASLDEEARPQLYVPLRFGLRETPAALAVLLKTSRPVQEANLNDALSGLGALASQTRWMSDAVAQSLGARRTARSLSTLQANAALVLVAFAVYGSFSWWLGLKSLEFAVRLALGDTMSGLARRTLIGAGAWIALSLGVGIALYLPASQLLRTLLFGVEPSDPAVLAVGSLRCGAVALGAAGFAIVQSLRKPLLDFLRSPAGSL